MAVRTMMLCFLAFITLLVSGYAAANEDCMFANRMFTPKRNKIGKMTEEECKDECGQQLNCIYWQMLEKDCWLHLADNKPKKDFDFGINNCKDGKPAGNAPQCEVSNGIGKLKQEVIKLPSSKDCMKNCDVDDCIIWEYNRKSEVCKISKLEVDKSSVGIHYCDQVPRQCKNYKVLNASTRNIKEEIGNGVNCDKLDNPYGKSTVDWQGPNWYRFEGGAGTQLATKPPGINHCGTYATGWTNSEVPSKVGSNKDIKVCFEWDKKDCYWSIAANATNCGSYMVYHFNNTPYCWLGYCGTN